MFLPMKLGFDELQIEKNKLKSYDFFASSNPDDWREGLRIIDNEIIPISEGLQKSFKASSGQSSIIDLDKYSEIVILPLYWEKEFAFHIISKILSGNSMGRR